MRITEAAHRLGIGIGRTKTYELIADGRLEVVRIDGAVRVPVAAIEEFVSECRRPTPVRVNHYGEPIGGGRPPHRYSWSAPVDH